MPTKLVETMHFHISQKLREKILELPPHYKLPTMNELQDQYGASRITIERALDRLRKDHLIYRPDGRQRYVVADIHDRSVRRIALIRPDYPSQDYDAICRVVVEAGKSDEWAFDLVSYSSMTGLDLEIACGSNDAMILLPTSEEFPEHILAALNRPRKPVVVLQEHLLHAKACNVCLDDCQTGHIAVEHLVALGHRRIAVILDQPRISTIDMRLKGWRDAMEQVGQRDLDELVLDCKIKSGQNALAVTYERFCHWLDGPHPEFSAIFCTSTMGGMAILRALDERKIAVPTEMSVVAYAGESIMGPFIHPGLTAIEMDMQSYGRSIVDILEKLLMNKRIEPRLIYVQPYLTVRSTTAPRRA